MELSQKEFEELFTLKEYLGEGTFGFVNTAVCHSNGLKYAVKQILMPRDLNHLQRVLKESEIMKKLDHKNVIKCTYVAMVKKDDKG